MSLRQAGDRVSVPKGLGKLEDNTVGFYKRCNHLDMTPKRDVLRNKDDSDSIPFLSYSPG